ncbi:MULTISPECIES: alpha/beta fold hydrolase [unclassified Pseudomonas]|uniref:alpha/beta fold hydrolase n=1 Tax=unclassified Pseudomonas TaxID=196821 RepID=UPI000C2F90BB|nr:MULTISPECIES: alpha/beta hydrolase [unclassified Pseudomonas]MCU1739290.1 alpha/beta hydrolase [Pseudomonas sp. 20S_6.2_Bac1]
MNKWHRPQAGSRFVSVDGMRMHYTRTGQGPLIVMLHGSGSSLQGFEQVAARLSRSFTVICPDLPGFGLTGPRPDRDYRVPTYAVAVTRFMQALELPACTLVGNSLGGNIAWNMALDFPERLNALVLINATGYPGKSLPCALRLARVPVLRALLRIWLPSSATARSLRSAVGPSSTIIDSAMISRVHGLMSLPGNRSAFVDVANTDQKDRSAQIPHITTPTLVLRSAAVHEQHFTQDITGSVERVHSEAGHLLPEEDPAWVSDAIEAFLCSGAHRNQAQGYPR